MRPRRFLLVTKALSAAGLVAACGKENAPPPPGNPKGSIAYDAGPPLPLPGNPKGSNYEPPPPPTRIAPYEASAPKPPPTKK